MYTPLTDIFHVPEGKIFECKGYYYKIEKGSLMYKTVDGWKVCSHSEVIYVYSRRDIINEEED